MAVAIITGSAGLVGSEAAIYFGAKGFDIVGVDNDMRRTFFGDEASTKWNREHLADSIASYAHNDIDIRDQAAIESLFGRYGKDVSLVVHTAAQPSHDWAAKEPLTDFTVNAVGTLNMLEATRKSCPDARFIFTSTNKVYGDAPNELPLIERETRWDIDPKHACVRGIDETMRIDRSKHSLFGVSKAAADLMVQEYGKYFGMKTVCFRGGCLTGPNHSGTKLHGFLAYLMRCTATGIPYTVIGYKGKQVRDNIHSQDLIRAFDAFYQQPKSGEVYNMGGGVQSNCSMMEAIALCQQITGRELKWTYQEANRIGDHIWYVSDLSKFKADYSGWDIHYDIKGILTDIFNKNAERWKKQHA